MQGTGILLHLTSLPGAYGIGALGAEARRFLDFLADSGQTVWQMLPVGMTSYGDSPYQSPSAFAGNPYLIDFEELRQRGLLTAADLKDYENAPKVDYEYQFRNRYRVLRRAFSRFRGGPEYERFALQNRCWLEEFCLFMALKVAFQHREWIKWPAWARLREKPRLEAFAAQHSQELDFWKFTQFCFFEQWSALRRYAGLKGIRLIGDMPIYASYDSADVWANRELFCLNGRGRPIEVAGVPPDAFSEEGQLWGNALYDWNRHREQGYRWWVERFRLSMRLFDCVRIDHFRGFAAYYAVPYGDVNALRGVWRKGPGRELFDVCRLAVPSLSVIAEDLGTLDEDVFDLLRETRFPGMKVLQFAFDGNPDNPYLPKNCGGRCAVYTGTHDNPTTQEWYDEQSAAARRRIRRILRAKKGESGVSAMVRSAMQCGADLVVIPMQDYLAPGEGSRMNVPSVAQGNWRWRLSGRALNSRLKAKLRGYLCERRGADNGSLAAR